MFLKSLMHQIKDTYLADGANSTKAGMIDQEFSELRSKLPTLWTESKFISSVGSVTLEVVKKYIEEQKTV